MFGPILNFMYMDLGWRFTCRTSSKGWFLPGSKLDSLTLGFVFNSKQCDGAKLVNIKFFI